MRTTLAGLVLCLFFIYKLAAQEAFVNTPDSRYQFKITHRIASLPVQNQGKTGTCWSFSGISFIESELARLNKSATKLSEMFAVRTIYTLKAERIIRMHGHSNLAEGGEPQDVLDCWKQFGMMPLVAYDGFQNENTTENALASYQHTGLDSIIFNLVEPLASSTETIYSNSYKYELEKILNYYLGPLPESFYFEGKTYNPKTYAQSLGIKPEDYISFTSFNHHPYYTSFPLEIPDNWAQRTYNNVPLDVFESIIVQALENGYGVSWAADVSEPYFKFEKGLALVPKQWHQMNAQQKQACFIAPCSEETITPELRQEGFDSFETQDDHAMHLIGLVKDQNNKTYVLVKNSWGTSYNSCSGYFLASLPYIRYKSISLMVHKSALSPEIRKVFNIN